MSTLRNGTSSGVNGTYTTPVSKRFSDIPSAIDVPVHGEAEDEAVEIDLEALFDDPTEVCTLLENERAARTYWMTVALAYAKQKNIDHAIEMLIRGGNSMRDNNPREKLSLIGCLCWMYLWKVREAPRLPPDGQASGESAKTKEHYLQLATTTLNEASRINPAFPPLFLARGVLQLLRASLQTPKLAARGAQDTEKEDLLRAALKSFEDAIRVSQGKNMLAVMGKARTYFSLGKYAESLANYQEVLSKMPDLVDPDPRIGIGCCYWQLGFKDDAKQAWERCLEINPEHKTGNILLGLYYLDASGRVPANSTEFVQLYKRAMTEFTQKSFKLDKSMPLTCATFAGYFLSRKQLSTVETLAHKAIQYTDVNAIASDGWYLLARKEHYEGDPDRAADYYRRADDARGGANGGCMPAKFGAAQLSVMKGDLGEAKLALEKILQVSKHQEAMVLLGTLYAEEVFASQAADMKDDKSAEVKKAITLLEGVRTAWKDPKKGLNPDTSVLLNLARLYEGEYSDRALKCLLQVEQLEMEEVEKAHPTEGMDEAEAKRYLRKFLSPQLLNNIGCFYSQIERYGVSSDMFESALDACMRISEGDSDVEIDALVTTISFNLGRSYESRGLIEDATKVYEELLKRHDDYTDAQVRLAYIKLRKHPHKEGPEAISKLYRENPRDLEVRALYGWYLGKIPSRKKSQNINEDDEFRHYKHTLRDHDKHDRYALVGAGNLHLMLAREMRRESESDRTKRSSMYTKAVEFFEKALSLDPLNAYAAQGIAIALVEDQKDHKTALGIFLKARDTVRDPHIYVNLGHIYADLRQYSKAVENYETALSKEGKANDPLILACLGRTWLNKGRAERDVDAYNESLAYAKKALEAAPDQVHYKFNVAFVQIQLATTIYQMTETTRTLAQLRDAAEGLELAITALDEIAGHPQTPYPKHDVEQRANMARNTQRKQLERAIASQKEYEEKNKERLQAALEKRQLALRKREEEREKAIEMERERQAKIQKDREEMAARDREMALKRAEEERARAAEEMTTDTETGERVKRKRKAAPRGTGSGRSKRDRRKKKAGQSEGDGSGDEDRPTKKKRRLTKRESEKNSKYKSAEIIVDSDVDDEDEPEDDDLDRAERAIERARRSDSDRDEKDDGEEDRMEVDDADEGGAGGDEEDTGVSRRQQTRARRGRILESDEEDENEDAAPGGNADKDDDEDDDDDVAPPPPKADTSMVDQDEEDSE